MFFSFKRLMAKIHSGALRSAAAWRSAKQRTGHHIEMIGLKREIERLFSELGGRTYELLSADSGADVAGDEEVREWMEKLKLLEAKYHARNAEENEAPSSTP